MALTMSIGRFLALTLALFCIDSFQSEYETCNNVIHLVIMKLVFIYSGDYVLLGIRWYISLNLMFMFDLATNCCSVVLNHWRFNQNLIYRSFLIRSGSFMTYLDQHCIWFYTRCFYYNKTLS